MSTLDENDSILEEEGMTTGGGGGSIGQVTTSFTALKLQRKQRLESLIEKRKNNFLYFMEIHSGESYWLNSVLIDKKELNSYLHEKASTRAVMYFYLGISLSKILDLPAGPMTVRAIIQLLEEWEYYFTSTTMQSMKYVMARTSNFIYPNFMPNDSNSGSNTSGGGSGGGGGGGGGNSSGGGSGGNNNQTNTNGGGGGSGGNTDIDHQIKSGIYKFNNDIVYEYLQIPHIPFELNYIEVVYSLCQMLYALYDKFWHEDSFSIITYYDAIVKLDGRLKHFIINLIAKEFTDRSCQHVENEIDLIRASLHNI